MTRAMCAVALVCAFALSMTTANAKPRHHKHQFTQEFSFHNSKHHRHIASADSTIVSGCEFDNNGRQICRGPNQRIQGRSKVTSYDGVIGGRPAGCPHAFCGCEASRYVFGKIYPDLNLASNWLRKFPRTSPAPGMVAARNHHVFVLIAHVEGSDWLAHDGNSGGGKTREHVVSISRYVIVDPHGSRLAMR